jgi:Raf kinase inhibitor-like YbhB/YbcL family protein
MVKVALVALLAATTAAATAAATMSLHSGDFAANGVIPQRAMALDCGGANRSPQLSWSGAPSATKSFALVVRDPDAPIAGGFYHWIVYNLPATTHGLPAGVRLASDQLGVTSRGTTGYYGPCPPPGPAHHYFFTLYALDVARVRSDQPLTATQFEARIAGHVVARTWLIGLRSHP